MSKFNNPLANLLFFSKEEKNRIYSYSVGQFLLKGQIMHVSRHV